jgi:hypothetical protein
MKGFSPDAVNFEELLRRLTLHAQSLSTAMVCVGLDEAVLPGGESAEDLAITTLMKFLDPLDLCLAKIPSASNLGPSHECVSLADRRLVL